MAILNIAVNARDAMPGGGTLKFALRNLAANGEGARGRDFVALTISDTGIGMATSVLDRAFEPFFSTKKVGEGTGLGLSQVYGFVKQSGGDIHIESSLGNGTRLTLYLPRAAAQLPRKAPAAEPAAKRHQPATILVVEDDEAIADLAQLSLSEHGYQTEVAHNAPDALRLLSAGLAVDLVFSDVVMPGGMNGLELVRELRKRRPDLPVLLTTGYAAVASKAGTVDVPILAKPYRASVLCMAVASAIEVARHKAATRSASSASRWVGLPAALCQELSRLGVAERSGEVDARGA
jgi:CheY-like chemotaxis protein